MLVVLERHCLALREEVEHLHKKTRSCGYLDGGQNENAECSTRKLSEGDLPGVERTGGAEDERSAGACTKEAQVEKIEKVKRRGQGLCKGWSRQGQ